MPSGANARQSAGVPPERLLVRWGERAARVIAFGLGAVFLWAAFWKAVDPRDTEAVFRYLLGDGWVVSEATLTLICVEILLGAALIAGVAPRWSMLASAIVLGAFVAWLAWLATTGVALDCGCALSSRAGDGGVGWQEVLRTGALAAGAMTGVALAWRAGGGLGEQGP